MANVICAIGDSGNVIKGTVGFYNKEQFEERYNKVIVLKDRVMPKDYCDEHYVVDTVLKCLKKRPQSEIDAIPKKKTFKQSEEYLALMKLDPEVQHDTTKVILNFLRKIYG